VKLKELSGITSTLSVLYVEDDITLREQNNELFKELFHTIDVATDGEEALNLYKKQSFDIVITDINIPKINGLSMIKMMQEKRSNQKFLITTVYKQEELESQLKEMNLKHFLTKPIPTKWLLRKIEDIVNELEVAC